MRVAGLPERWAVKGVSLDGKDITDTGGDFVAGQQPLNVRVVVTDQTGTLTGVHGLAGVADDASGARMAFVVVADRVRPPKNGEAQALIDRIAGAVGACRCGVGSGP